MRLVGLLFVTLLFSLSGGFDPARAEEEPKPEGAFVVKVDGERLTVRLQGIPLHAALKAIERESGVALALLTPLTEEITIAFENLPLEQGLRRLLGNHSYILFYAATGPGQPAALRQVKVLPKGREVVRAGDHREQPRVMPSRPPGLGDPDPEKRTEAVMALAAGEEPGKSLDLLIEILRQDKDNDVREAALHALGSLDPIPLEPLLAVAFQDKSPSIRVRALTLLGEQGAGDPRVKAALQRAATSDPDREVMELASSLLEGFDMQTK
jgi:HEAT repeat protein